MTSGFLAGGGFLSGLFDHTAELPRLTPVTTYPGSFTSTNALTDTGNAVTNATNLQTAITNAAALDGNNNYLITLPPAGTGVRVPASGIQLKKKTGTNPNGTGWIVIASAGSIPAAGTRVSVGKAPPTAGVIAQLAQVSVLATSGADSCFYTEAGAHHYRLVGLECFYPTTATVSISGFITLGDGSNDQSNPTFAEPHHIGIDRCYIHGQPAAAMPGGTTTAASMCVRGIQWNCGETFVIDSDIREIHQVGQDNQALCGWNGSGPLLMQNNMLSASCECTMIGGADSFTTNKNPSDLTFRGNYYWKDPAWINSGAGTYYSVKNLFELKTGVRVLVENNTMENHWDNGQPQAVNIKSTSSGTATWFWTKDVTFRYNEVRRAPAGINLSEYTGTGSLSMVNVSIHDNLFEAIGTFGISSNSRMIQMLGGINNTYICNNTLISNDTADGALLFLDILGTVPKAGNPTNFTFNNNIGYGNNYGVFNNGGGGGKAGLDQVFLTSYAFQGNVVVQTNAQTLPTGNSIIASDTSVVFTNNTTTVGQTPDYTVASGVGLTAGVGGTLAGADVVGVKSNTSTNGSPAYVITNNLGV